jgi:DNA protecting protein DprA
MQAETSFWYALTFLCGLSHGAVHDLAKRWLADGRRTIRELLDAKPSDWEGAGLTAQECAAVGKARAVLGPVRKALRPLEAAGISILASGDRRYPQRMTATLGRSRPPALFCAGNIELLQEPVAAIIGARKPSREALDFTRAAAQGFARAGLVVVSGFAEGVDRCASEAALDEEGATILVLAQGILTFGRERTALTSWMDQGRLLVLSAFEPRSTWQTAHAMARNGMITALAPDVVVAHANPSGGAWEAARGALRQGKRVWIRRDDNPELGHTGLVALGARAVEWPSEGFQEWLRETARNAAEEHGEKPGGERWTEASVMDLLRTGSAADVHDASGLTGELLARIIEGRDKVALNTLNDLAKIKGLGPGAVRDVALAFDLSPPPPASAQLTLFPEIEEFPGWDGDLASPMGNADASPLPPERRATFEDLAAPQGAPEGSPGTPREDSAAGSRGEGPAVAVEKARLPAGAATIPPARRRRKNLLLLLTSRQRADALGCYGNSVAQTPNLDRLAEDGALFERAYVASPQSAPERASLLTGASLCGHGVWTDGVRLDETVPTLASHLAALGYRTACVGKMHLSPYAAPADSRSKESQAYWETGLMDNWNGPYYGFNQARLVMGHGDAALAYGHYGRWLKSSYPSSRRTLLQENAIPSPSGLENSYILECDPDLHPTKWIAAQTVAFMERSRDNPFFIVCSFPDPHPPYAPLAEFARRYESADFPEPIPPPEDAEGSQRWPPHILEAWQGAGPAEGSIVGVRAAGITERQLREIRAHTCAMVAQIDEAIGWALGELSRLGLAEDTLVVFTSDHGDLLGDHGFIGAGPLHYEGVIRAPFLWSMPGTIPSGRRLAGVVSHLDFVPTACALIGVPCPSQSQGVALDPYMEGKVAASPRLAALVEYPSRHRRRLNLKTVVTAREKATYYPGQSYGEYYNLEEDPDERRNGYDRIPVPVRLELMEHLLNLQSAADNRLAEPVCGE